MSERRKSSRAAFCATVILIVGVLYVASFGPACWISSRTQVGAALVPKVYRPMTWAMSGSQTAFEVLNSYAQLGAENGWNWYDFNRFSALIMEITNDSPDWRWLKLKAM
jgi:hypothetical protein